MLKVKFLQMLLKSSFIGNVFLVSSTAKFNNLVNFKSRFQFAYFSAGENV